MLGKYLARAQPIAKVEDCGNTVTCMRKLRKTPSRRRQYALTSSLVNIITDFFFKKFFLQSFGDSMNLATLRTRCKNATWCDRVFSKHMQLVYKNQMICKTILPVCSQHCIKNVNCFHFT